MLNIMQDWMLGGENQSCTSQCRIADGDHSVRIGFKQTDALRSQGDVSD